MRCGRRTFTDWFDELVKAGEAIDLGGTGYPLRYTATARYVPPRLVAGPPEARETWVLGVGDTTTEKRAGATVVDRDAIAACPPGEWLLVEAWDES